MTEIKHTPGPWVSEGRFRRIQVDEYDHTAFCCDITTKGPAWRGGIAYIQSAEHIEGITRHEAEANARLISSAPDLLEALKHALVYQPKDDSCDPWVSDARAAIAKAEGASNV